MPHQFLFRHVFVHCLLLALPSLAMAAGTNITSDQSSLLAFIDGIIAWEPNQLAKNWSTASSACQWMGVTCGSRHRRVVALNISNMDLFGTIPPQLGNLSFLVSLDLSGNNFHGGLPNELARLHRLKVFKLNNNNVTGELPVWFGFLHKLQFLSLRNNSFTGYIPSSFSNLTNLEVLNLSYNFFEGTIPVEIGNLHNLKDLIIENGQLSGSLPFEIFNISSLERISLVSNGLSGVLPDHMCRHLPRLKWLGLFQNMFSGEIPSSLSLCSQLQMLGLSYNIFTGLVPKHFGKLMMLQEIYLASNNLQGSIPHEIFNISTLQWIGFENNSFSGDLPDYMCRSQSLVWLTLNNNMFTGEIPLSLSQCLDLQMLALSYNNFIGIIPKEIGNLKMLQLLHLSSNNLQGSIPRGIGNLTEIQELWLNDNYLTGIIPEEIGNLNNLQRLHVQNNTLSGSIPFGSLANCKSLVLLALNDNHYDSILPDSVGNLSSSLQQFYAQNSRIKGKIPDAIGNLSGLFRLNLNENQLIGSVPSTVRNIQNLQELAIGMNQLSGPIPDGLCDLQDIGGLILRENQLSGSIPECFGNLTFLRYRDLGSNLLFSVRTELWNLKDLLEIDLSSNFFSGFLPPEVGKLKGASFLDLSNNQLNGELPSTIGDLQELKFFHAKSNKFQGTIPESIGKMLSLEALDLSNNEFSGSIPRSLEELQYLKYFNCSFNNLKGEIPSGGPFQNFTFESFEFNEALCGEQRFNVSPCPAVSTQRSKKRWLRTRTIWVVSGILAIAVVLVVGGVYLVYKKRYRVPISDKLLLLETSERISYRELLQATNGYDQSNLIGKGGMGSVYKGTLSDGRILAIKVFNSQLEGGFKSFETECRVLSNIRHRNLTKVITSCSNSDFKAIVLEFMPNGSLEKWLYSYNNFLDIKQRLNIMTDVARALQYLHFGFALPIVHCDLKPSNILLDQDVIAHVNDFGIAKLLGGEENVISTQTLATFGYMAPEYGLEGSVSTNSDVYSYGIMLMDVFTRTRPTDEMFGENLSLKDWVKNSYPKSLVQVIDGNIIKANEAHLSEKLECLSSIMEVALTCSRESPSERCNMQDVLVALEKIKVKYSNIL